MFREKYALRKHADIVINLKGKHADEMRRRVEQTQNKYWSRKRRDMNDTEEEGKKRSLGQN